MENPFFILSGVLAACIVMPLLASDLRGLRRVCIVAAALAALVGAVYLLTGSQSPYLSMPVSLWILSSFAISAILYALGLWLRDRGYRRWHIQAFVYPAYALLLASLMFPMFQGYEYERMAGTRAHIPPYLVDCGNPLDEATKAGCARVGQLLRRSKPTYSVGRIE